MNRHNLPSIGTEPMPIYQTAVRTRHSRRQTLFRSGTMVTVTTARRAVGLVDAWAARSALLALIGLVIAGIFAMHVLGSHDQDGDHSMSVSAPGVVAAHASAAHPGSDMSDMADMAVVAAAGDGSAVTSAAGHGMPGSMAGCILFLVGVGGLVVALMLALALAGGRNPDVFDARGSFRIRRRGPPGTAPPHFSLCVLRV